MGAENPKTRSFSPRNARNPPLPQLKIKIKAEITENTCRRPCTPSEAVSPAERLLPLAQEAAQNRMYHREDEGASVNFTEGGEALHQIAKLLDLSRFTLEKAVKVVEVARQENTRKTLG